MRPVRPTIPRRLRRLATFTSAAAVCASTLAFAVPGASASATGLAPGNLLVSTSQFTDVPAITAGTTTLPISGATAFVTNVTSSGSAPNIVATITTAAKDGLSVGSSVSIAGVLGATQVNGTFTVATVPSTTQFTISMGSTTVSPYTSGGSTTQNTTTAAVASGTYPFVFNNANADANFGVTEPIVLDQIPATTSPASVISQIAVPNSDITSGDQLVTSFSSKSELALNQSTDGSQITFMGYNAPTGAVDVSNSNTPIEIDPTNSDVAGATPLHGYYRNVAAMDANGDFQFTETGAYGGNNGRAAILNSANGTIYTAGNAGNGANPPYQGVVIGSGSQIMNEATTSQAAQESVGVPTPTPFGNFNITQLSTASKTQAADKPTKDDNFRGLTDYNGVIYMSKGSGSNGVDTVYFVDTTGTACPAGSGGVGVPQAGATLPSASTWSSSSLAPTFSTSNAALGLTATNPGLAPTNMCILNGFSTALASGTPTMYPFGMWFANPTTLYVADEGSGTFPASSTDTTGGLQKWTLNTATNVWGLDYTLSNGLALKSTYPVANSPAGVDINGSTTSQSYPTGTNSTQGGKGGNWAPATDGLRNIVGRINGDGTVTIWATTSTISGSGDQGADPNQVVAVTDSVAATALPSTETFSTVLPATDGIVYRGVSFTPTTPVPDQLPEAVWAPLIPLTAVAMGGGFVWRRNRRRTLPLV